MSADDVLETIRLNLAELPRANADACEANCLLAASLLAGADTATLDALDAAAAQAEAALADVGPIMVNALADLRAAIAGAR